MRHLEISHPSGRARLERVPRGWSVDLVDADGPEEATDLLAAAKDAVRDAGGGTLRLWVRAGDPATTAAGQRLGLTSERDLHQLRRPLPVDEPWELPVRPFVVGQDEAAWLAVNNRAFDWHPEQGGWTLQDLQARVAGALVRPRRASSSTSRTASWSGSAGRRCTTTSIRPSARST